MKCRLYFAPVESAQTPVPREDRLIVYWQSISAPWSPLALAVPLPVALEKVDSPSKRWPSMVSEKMPRLARGLASDASIMPRCAAGVLAGYKRAFNVDAGREAAPGACVADAADAAGTGVLISEELEASVDGGVSGAVVQALSAASAATQAMVRNAVNECIKRTKALAHASAASIGSRPVENVPNAFA